MLTDGHDVGKYAAAAFQDPAKFSAQEIEMTNGAYTFDEIRDILKRVSGKDVKVIQRTAEEMESMGITVFGQKFHLWANMHNFGTAQNIAREVETKYGIPLTSLEDALRRDKPRLMDCLSVI